MKRKAYTNIAIPKTLATAIDQAIKEHKLAYTSRAQFVLEAIRTKLELGKRYRK